MDTTHLSAHFDRLATLEMRLSKQSERLHRAKTAHERALVQMWIAQTKREISDTLVLIGRMTT